MEEMHMASLVFTTISANHLNIRGDAFAVTFIRSKTATIHYM